MSCTVCQGTGYMTATHDGVERVVPCTHCLVGSARWWEEKQKAAALLDQAYDAGLLPIPAPQVMMVHPCVGEECQIAERRLR